MTRPIRVIYVAAAEDEPVRQKLETHLALLEQQGKMQGWHAQQILAGSVKAQHWEEALRQASVIVLLISADFFASALCREQMEQALERQRRGAVRVIPILLRAVDGKEAPFAQLKMLPTNGVPITSWPNPEEAFAEVARDIRRVIEEGTLPSVVAASTALPPIWNIPHPRNLYFLGRDKELTQLHEELQAGQVAALSQSPHALSGLGGIGKTQIAVEYAYRYGQEYQVVLWAQAESQEALRASYVEIASLLNLSEKEVQEQAKTIQAVKQWLQNHGEWLLIVDNADELKILPEFLPPVMGGHLLLTTRAQALGRLARKMEVKTMDQDKGALLLLRRAGVLSPDGLLEQASKADQAVAREMSLELGGLPLALDQAGAYLEKTGCGLATYATIYQQHRKELLRESGGLVKDHPEAVATTWSLSFAKVQEQSPAAADLLQVCAFLSPGAIPEALLTQGAAVLGPQLAPVAGDALLLNKAIEVLRAYSLVSRDAQTKSLSVHRLVQAVIKDGMKKAVKKRWVERVIRAVAESLPEVEHKQWGQWEQMVVHALVCAEEMKAYVMTFSEATQMLQQTGWYLMERGRYGEAQGLLERALHRSEQQQGRGVDTARNAVTLAALYHVQGKYAEVEPLLKRVLAIREQSLEPRHPSIAVGLNNLAMLYHVQGKYAEAEPLLKRVLAIKEQALGLEHPSTAASLHNLASLYKAQGKYAEAEPLYTQALKIWEQELGPTHPWTAKGLNNLAALYQDQGKYEQAEPLLERALAIREQKLGPGHPDTATSLNNLAALYDAQGKYAEAEPLFQMALEMREHSLGAEHPDTATSLFRLAVGAQQQQQYEKALAQYERAWGIYKRVLGVKHPTTQRLLGYYAGLLRELGREEEAVALEAEEQ